MYAVGGVHTAGVAWSTAHRKVEFGSEDVKAKFADELFVGSVGPPVTVAVGTALWIVTAVAVDVDVWPTLSVARATRL